MSYHRIKKIVGDEILAKYKNTCTRCGGKNNLCVHHIIRMEENDIEFNNPQFLTVLCRKCHMSYHRRAGHVIPPEHNPPVNSWGRRGKNNPPVKCKYPGCDKFQHGRGWCNKRRHGRL